MQPLHHQRVIYKYLYLAKKGRPQTISALPYFFLQNYIRGLLFVASHQIGVVYSFS